jgi:UPF0271 protein
MKEFVMDSPVILNNFNFSFSENEKYYSTNEVLNEIIDLRSKQLVEVGLRQGKLEVREPSKKTLEFIKESAKRFGLIHKLSKADLSIIALAYELKKPLLSDDYHVQKMCLYLNIEFDSIFREKISN